MIQLLEVENSDRDVQAHFVPEVQTYDVICNPVLEDPDTEIEPFPNYRIANLAMVWIGKDGAFGQIETINPPIVNESLCQFAKEIKTNQGFPKFEVVSCDNHVWVQRLDKGFVIWLAKERSISEQICYKTLVFLVSSKELVGIEAREIIIEQ